MYLHPSAWISSLHPPPPTFLGIVFYFLTPPTYSSVAAGAPALEERCSLWAAAASSNHDVPAEIDACGPTEPHGRDPDHPSGWLPARYDDGMIVKGGSRSPRPTTTASIGWLPAPYNDGMIVKEDCSLACWGEPSCSFWAWGDYGADNTSASAKIMGRPLPYPDVQQYPDRTSASAIMEHFVLGRVATDRRDPDSTFTPWAGNQLCEGFDGDDVVGGTKSKKNGDDVGKTDQKESPSPLARWFAWIHPARKREGRSPPPRGGGHCRAPRGHAELDGCAEERKIALNLTGYGWVPGRRGNVTPDPGNVRVRVVKGDGYPTRASQLVDPGFLSEWTALGFGGSPCGNAGAKQLNNSVHCQYVSTIVIRMWEECGTREQEQNRARKQQNRAGRGSSYVIELAVNKYSNNELAPVQDVVLTEFAEGLEEPWQRVSSSGQKVLWSSSHSQAPPKRPPPSDQDKPVDYYDKATFKNKFNQCGGYNDFVAPTVCACQLPLANNASQREMFKHWSKQGFPPAYCVRFPVKEDPSYGAGGLYPTWHFRGASIEVNTLDWWEGRSLRFRQLGRGNTNFAIQFSDWTGMYGQVTAESALGSDYISINMGRWFTQEAQKSLCGVGDQQQHTSSPRGHMLCANVGTEP